MSNHWCQKCMSARCSMVHGQPHNPCPACEPTVVRQPAPWMSPFVRRALARELPAKEIAR